MQLIRLARRRSGNPTSIRARNGRGDVWRFRRLCRLAGGVLLLAAALRPTTASEPVPGLQPNFDAAIHSQPPAAEGPEVDRFDSEIEPAAPPPVLPSADRWLQPADKEVGHHGPGFATGRELLSYRAWDLRTGAVFPLGGGTFEDRLHPGWSIQLSVRERWKSAGPEAGYFWELGGGYVGQEGKDRPVVISGTFSARTDDHVHHLDDFFATELKRLQRAGAHAGLGGIWRSSRMSGAWERDILLSARVGGRVGHLTAEFDSNRTSALQNLVDGHLGHGHTPDEFRFHEDLSTTDTYLGLYGSLGVGTVFEDVSCSDWFTLGDVILSAEAEFIHDWFDLDGFGRSDDGLATVSAILSLTVLR